MMFNSQITLWTMHVVGLMLSCGSDSVEYNWTNVLPHFNVLCPSVVNCGGTDNADVKDLDENPCCKERPCETDNPDSKRQTAFEGLTRCLEPSKHADLIGIKIKFVTDPPLGGCVKVQSHTDGPLPSCNPDVIAAPWGNFYPVYSFDKQINFINENCARCHGATDNEKWWAFVLYGVDAITGLLTTDKNHEFFNSSEIILSFDPPDKKSIDYTDICFDVINTCHPDVKDVFNIPSNMNMTHSEIVQACEQGPHALYVVTYAGGYHNVFCALCNEHYSAEKDSAACGISDQYYGGRSPTNSFVTLLVAEYIEAKTHESGLSPMKTPKACRLQVHESEDPICREVLCPSLQARYPDGNCDYPMEKLYVNKIIVSLNLTTTDHINQVNIRNMSDNSIKSLFRRFFPWQNYWEILLVAKRMDTSNIGYGTSEFTVFIGCETNGFVITKDFLRNSLSALSRTWPIDHSDGRTVFTQNFMRHGYIGIDDRLPISEKIVLWPSWAILNSNHPFKSNISSPTWQLLYSQIETFYGYNAKSIFYLTKLLYCDQIELQENEYKTSPLPSPLYLIHTKTYLFPNDYHRYINDDGTQAVIICLEDSNLILTGSQNSATTVKIIGLYACTFVLVLL